MASSNVPSLWCWPLCHTWAKWEQYTVVSRQWIDALTGAQRDVPIRGEQIRERRVCQQCGHMQDRLVRRG